MSDVNTNTAMIQLIRELRDQVERLRESQDELARENRYLREQMERQAPGSFRNRQSTRPARALDRLDPNDRDLRRLLEERGLSESGQTHGHWQSSEPHSAPALAPRTSPAQVHDAYAPSGGSPFGGATARQSNDYLPSGYYGAGVRPNEAVARGVEPASPSIGGAAIDVGYVNQVEATDLENLPYGLIVLDVKGNVLFYNETEEKLTGFRRERVLGKHFFSEVAPCTQVKAFQGRFDEFVKGSLGRTTCFNFVFHFESGAQEVLIYLSHGRRRGHINVMMLRR